MNLSRVINIITKIWKFLIVRFKMNKGNKNTTTTDIIKNHRIKNKEIIIKIKFNPFLISIDKKVEFEKSNETIVKASGFHISIKNE